MKKLSIYLVLCFSFLLTGCMQDQLKDVKTNQTGTSEIVKDASNVKTIDDSRESEKSSDEELEEILKNTEEKKLGEALDNWEEKYQEELDESDESDEYEKLDENLSGKLTLLKRIENSGYVFEYYTDQNYVYSYEDGDFKILSKDKGNFKILEKGFSKDLENVFLLGERKFELDTKTFEIYKEPKNIDGKKVIAEDKNHYLLLDDEKDVSYKIISKKGVTDKVRKFGANLQMPKPEGKLKEIYDKAAVKNMRTVYYRYGLSNYTTHYLTKEIFFGNYDHLLSGADYSTFEYLGKYMKTSDNKLKKIENIRKFTQSNEYKELKKNKKIIENTDYAKDKNNYYKYFKVLTGEELDYFLKNK